MTLRNHDLALDTARFGAGRFGASRFGFMPDDVLGAGTVQPGQYVWAEQTPESQIVDTVWTLQSEDCVCRQLCTLVIGTLTTNPSPPNVGQTMTLTVPLSGVLGNVSGVIRIHWGDHQHETVEISALANGNLTYTHIYGTSGAKTITVQLTDERGCRKDQTLAVTVGSTASVYFTWVQDPEDGLVRFTAVTGAVPVDTIDWDFGIGAGFQLDLGSTPNHDYGHSSGPFLIQMRVNVTADGILTDTFNMTANWAAGQSGTSQ